ncbi:MAG: hypothetical protein DCC58_09960 [Chloroflexi bacterium]|nr:MAG: hypothetical protein DCC58_09960 [Chloroflexota bacterium]
MVRRFREVRVTRQSFGMFARSRHAFAIVVALVCILLAGARLQSATAVPAANDAFNATWARSDKPVADGVANRTWLWGPGPINNIEVEPYAESPGGMREVRYYDKARMEVTHPDGDPSNPWYVTNGLLVWELIHGKVQLGDYTFEERAPAEINVAGDLDAPNAPTYATMQLLLYVPAFNAGETLIYRIDRDGEITQDPTLAAYGATTAFHVQQPGLDHQVASPFWEFMNSSGTIWDGEAFVDGPLHDNPFYATGFPLTEAYWTTVLLAGEPTDVLVQCFERRCLTWTPDNPDGWQVEAGNVGQHYALWRSSWEPPTPTPTATSDETATETATSPTGETPTSTETGVSSPTSTNTAGATATSPAGETATATDVSASPTATNTVNPTSTPRPTNTPRPTSTPSPTATATLTPSPTPTMYETLENAQATKVPWSGWYWPLPPSSTLPNLYDPGGAMEKYDAYVQKTRGYNPRATQWELDHHSQGASWSGHCHAWAAAAIMEPEPQRQTIEGITFTQDQVEGLLTEMYNAPAYKYWGTQCDDCNKNGEIFKDVTPAEFDAVMRQYIGQERRPVILDVDPSTPIWNYPAFKYTRGSVVNGDTETVTMVVTIAVPRINVGGTATDTLRYTYTLKAGTPGEWTGASVNDHPDYIWIVTGRVRNGGRVNDGMSYNIVQEIIRGGPMSATPQVAERSLAP